MFFIQNSLDEENPCKNFTSLCGSILDFLTFVSLSSPISSPPSLFSICSAPDRNDQRKKDQLESFHLSAVCTQDTGSTPASRRFPHLLHSPKIDRANEAEHWVCAPDSHTTGQEPRFRSPHKQKSMSRLAEVSL